MSGRTATLYFVAMATMLVGIGILVFATLSDVTVPSSAFLADMEKITGSPVEGERVANLPRVASKLANTILGSAIMLSGFVTLMGASVSHTIEIRRVNRGSPTDPASP